MGSVLLALVVLALFGAGGWAAWRFGADILPAEPQRRVAAGAIAGCGLVIATLVLLNRPGAPEIDEFVVTTEVNQGAVAYPIMVRQAGVQHALQIAPQRDAGAPLEALRVRVILSDPQGGEVINDVVTIAIGETDVADAGGGTVRAVGWIPWSQTFLPSAAGFYEIALSLPPNSPRLRVRVGAPPAAAE